MTLDATQAWFIQAHNIMTLGDEVSPRGMKTREVPHGRVIVDMKRPVLMLPERRLQASFLGGEAHWIMSGDNRVETIEPYNKHITQFSDDGDTFAGAYGPMISDQWAYIVETLVHDTSTRQATLTIWKPNPPKSKDIPCTVAMNFQLRQVDGLWKLHTHVFMRSSDLWLGLPYDVFNFSMLSVKLVGQLNTYFENSIEPGNLYLTAASSHLYETHFEQVDKIIMHYLDKEFIPQHPVPEVFYKGFDTDELLMDALDSIRNSQSKADPCRWWNHAEA